MIEPHVGFKTRSKVCTGCKGPFTVKAPVGYPCDFLSRGFPFTDGRWAQPCGTVYHVKCIRAGAPFRTRLPNDRGLSFPANVPIPHFICECCQVRALVDRELDATPRDQALMMLERMRMIDVVSNWRQSTLGQYAPTLRKLVDFEEWSGIPTLKPTWLEKPPTGPIYGLMYAQLKSTLPRPGQDEGIKYSSCRRLRSAASMWYNLDMQLSYPDQAMRDQNRRCYLAVQACPTDTVGFTFLNSGMARRMGDTTNPSWALSHEHIVYIDRRLDQLYQVAPGDANRHELATAATANLMAWLGWLRGNELFGMGQTDVSVTRPELGPTVGLPPMCGVVQLRLAPETKSSPTRTADVVVAYTSGSGLSLGKWLERLGPHVDGPFVFSTPNRRQWNSSYFRHTFAVPLLEEMRQGGELSLRCFTDKEGGRIQDRLWSMHSWRRGGRSRVSRRLRGHETPAPGWRTATPDEILEHGRWRKRYRSESMAVHYNEWEVLDRVMITMVCM